MLLVGGRLPLWPRGWYIREQAGIFLLVFPCYQTSAEYSSNPHVGTIGGGMAVLACAFGWIREGNPDLEGRMGTRMIGCQPLIFDHAAQFFTVNDSRFGELVDVLIMIINEEKNNQHEHFAPLYYGCNFCETSMVNIVRPCWISNLEPFNGMCGLVRESRQSESPLGNCHRLWTQTWVTIRDQDEAWVKLSRIPFHRAVQCSDFGGAFVRGVDSVLWMANNSMKLLSSQSDGSHYWTFFNTAAYGERKQGSTGKYGSRGQMGQDPTNQLYEAKPKNKREP
ncbi:hypothetical protein KPL71_024228 [Citrus sinensis]|uniref:Uncharacterized protein n=1 Tax=Citrus sinensis TaxID=2711 RepID=A0ACB8IQZ1_CITSI|nr:hypothetical protein KPL71_024228 [Citrus sinensis]